MGRRIGVSAALGSFTVGIVLAIFEVQGWNMPAPLAVAFIVIMLSSASICFGVILYEIGKKARLIWQERVVSVAWVSKEAPGLLDFEADFKRGNERLISELKKLTKDTLRLSNRLPQHQERIKKAASSSDPRKKQKRANHASKDIGRYAIFISNRQKLFDSLVNEIYRNGKGILSTANLDQDEQLEAGHVLKETLDENANVTKTTIISISKYRDSVKGIVERNLSRTIRIESKRLVEALNHLVKTLQRHENNSRELKSMLNKRVVTNR